VTLIIDPHSEVTFGLQCTLCKHRDLGYGGGCAAFPDGIPLAIIQDEFDHRLPHPGDNGIRFELLDASLLEMAETTREEALAGAS
jgi:hypothetical protein